MKKDDKASISLRKVISISIILLFIMEIGVMAASSKLNSVKIILSDGYEMDILTSKTKISEILDENHIILLPNEKEENITEIPNDNSQTKEQEKMSESKKIIELNHPLIEHKLGILRNKNTGTKEFRELAGEIATFLCYKAMEDAQLEDTEIETPICKMKTKKLNEDKYAFVPILRAGMGMLDGVITVIPNAKIGHIGMYRDEKTHKPVNYFFKVPKNIDQKEVILLDPMLATGGSAIDAIELLKEKNVKKIKFLCIIAAPEGLKKVQEKHPDVQIYCAKIDDHLNENAYIVPGLGDAGDRIYGTK